MAQCAVTSELLDVCGLGLKIGPRFFEALYDKADRRTMEHPRRRVLGPFHQSYTVVGNQITTMANDYISGHENAPPVLLIVGWDDDDWGFDEDHHHAVSWRQTSIPLGRNKAPRFMFQLSQ